MPSGRDITAQDSGTARSWSLPAGALEYREPSSGDCVVIVKVPPELSQCRELGDPLVPSAFSEALCCDI